MQRDNGLNLSKDFSILDKRGIIIESSENKSVPHIWVLNKLPSEATKDDYQYVPITSVCPDWTAMPTFSDEVKKKYDTELFNATLEKKLGNYFNDRQAIYDHFVLVDMGKFGKGLFARKDIPAGTKLYYFGHISFSSEVRSEDTYCFSLTSVEMNSANTKRRLAAKDFLVIDGKDLPNYFQHLPDLKHKGDYNFTDDIKKIKTADFKPTSEQITDEFNILSIEAETDIKAGTFVGFDYSLSYWYGDTPAFFSEDGQELPNVVPYAPWHPAIVDLANFLLIELTEQLDNGIEISRELMIENLSQKISSLIDLSIKDIDELDKINEGRALEELKDFFNAEGCAQQLIQKIITLYASPTGKFDTKKGHKILDEDSAFCYLIKKVAPQLTQNIDHIRKQLFPYDPAAKLFIKDLEKKSKSGSDVKWHYKQDNNKSNHFTFWAQGKSAVISQLDKNLGSKIKHQCDAVIGKTDVSAIMIQKNSS